ncbi:hypothetical protein A9Q84_09450 [Halobacteriovorax marinus]|uniref:KilA-N DNA-binding domain-containing protein n=1 Tax=Halobacteriovorax marinus TaxID=97084 RepID=A0A1Y5F6Y9_9BACT|nr:hypothetical protein A9Q84_09450 [Halobacteriovorax marinus]
MKKDKGLLEITNHIYIIRNQKVMLDRDLAELYGVELRVLNQAVKRNIERFPEDFMFQLDSSELSNLWSQNVIMGDLTTRKYITRNPPYVFTEAGSFALSFTLRSQKAIEMGQFIIRAFTHLRRFILKNENLMMELKNNDHLSKTFSNFEKRIEHDLLILYKNTSKFEKRFMFLEDEINKLKKGK